ncbi:hypothetical protein [Pararhodobacter zhoushanensis]|uniref:hypothetical protein n=1 Tax=Pararhodobacter zhoushanensis TaxID=2479545 RepID=UPI000F8F583A|nr:hypothetical protein [Pararhodobacter zhoushanensis]
MTANPANGLFNARRPRIAEGGMFADLPQAGRPVARDPLDFDPTPDYATAPFIAAEGDAIRKHTAQGMPIWETAVGRGDLAGPLIAAGFDVVGSDLVDRGFPGVALQSFFDFTSATALSPVQITNPPFGEISARDGKGRWLRHAFNLGARYVALLLGSEWAQARINGFDALFHDHPPSIEYVCCFRIDFRGGGAPPQSNSWFVWDVNRPPLGPHEWRKRRLFREVADGRQGALDV